MWRHSPLVGAGDGPHHCRVYRRANEPTYYAHAEFNPDSDAGIAKPVCSACPDAGHSSDDTSHRPLR